MLCFMSAVPMVMTVIGRDRPGLVEQLAALVAKSGGNWLESRMCRLGGEFAGILRVEIPANRREELEVTLKEHKGFAIVVKPDQGEEPPPNRRVILNVTGQDRPGIVRELAGALAKKEASIEELDSRRESAPMSGEAIFRLRCVANAPETCSMKELREELEKAAADLMVDLELDVHEPAKSDVSCDSA